MEELIKRLGYKEIERQEFYRVFNSRSLQSEIPVRFCNLVVTIPATVIPEKKEDGEKEDPKIVVIGAHYDVQNSLSRCWSGNRKGNYTVTQGADDNSSGVIGCVALLRRLRGFKSSVTIKVILFDGEEPGDVCGLAVGSAYYVSQLNRELEEKESKKKKFATR